MKTSYEAVQPYVTKDGSLIRELMHPAVHGNRNLSFAQAIIEPGRKTLPHKHKKSEEIYHIIQGKGAMTLDKEEISIVPGDTVCICPNCLHSVENLGAEPLIIFCSCAPPYSHEDTEILSEMG